MLTKSTVVPLKIEIQMNTVFSYTIIINLTAGIRQMWNLEGCHMLPWQTSGKQKETKSLRHMRLESI